MEHIETVCSLESKLFLISIHAIRILDILEISAKTRFSKIAKCSTLYRDKFRARTKDKKKARKKAQKKIEQRDTRRRSGMEGLEDWSHI